MLVEGERKKGRVVCVCMCVVVEVGKLWRSTKYFVVYFLASAAGGPDGCRSFGSGGGGPFECNRFV